MGGEAIKVVEYFRHLLETGRDVVLVTHARNREYLQQAFPSAAIRYVPDSRFQQVMQRSPLRRLVMDAHFQWHARALIRDFDRRDVVLHYLCPISPIQPKFAPAGYRTVLGPLNGNLVYPPGFRARMPRSMRVQSMLYPVVQAIMGRLFADKRRADRVLVAGGGRSRNAVMWAGAAGPQILEVLDAGVSDALAATPALRHAGPCGRFMVAGRLDGYKGFDLAIEAIAAAGPDCSLSVYGDGHNRQSLEALAARLGVADRVTFHGWTPHERLIDAMRGYRALLFPSLAEANGIIMQEAMMVGLPVIALNWGGPAILGADGAAILIEPTDHASVVRAMAAAVRRLADVGTYADVVAVSGRRRAESSFRWRDVAVSWSEAYGDPAQEHRRAA